VATWNTDELARIAPRFPRVQECPSIVHSQRSSSYALKLPWSGARPPQA
jgi:hypothetical protein